MADVAGKSGVDSIQIKSGRCLMIKSVLVPGAGGMTYPAVPGKTRLDMVGAFRAGKVFLVAGDAFRPLIAEISSRMARGAFLRSVSSS